MTTIIIAEPSKGKRDIFLEAMDGLVPFLIKQKQSEKIKQEQMFSSDWRASLSFMLNNSKCHIYTISAAAGWRGNLSVSYEHLINSWIFHLNRQELEA